MSVQQWNPHYKLVDQLVIGWSWIMLFSRLQRLTFNFIANVPRRLPWPTILTHAITSFDDILFFMSDDK